MQKDKKNTGKKQDSTSSHLLSSAEFAKLKYYFEKAKKESKLSDEEIISELTSEPKIPVSVFNETLSGLETISKYMKENLNLDYKIIAKLLNRSAKTIWQAHFYAKKKFPEKFFIKETKFLIPVSALRNRKLSVLESIAIYLKDSLELRHHEIAALLKRDHSTIWTVCSRAKYKIKK